MNFIEKIYSIFLCLTRDDKYGDRHKRAAMGLEMVTTFIFTFIIMVILGLLNIKINNFLMWVLVLVFVAYSTSLLYDKYLIKSKRYVGVIEETKKYSKKKKLVFALLSVFLILISFSLMVGGGIIMSYFLSHH